VKLYLGSCFYLLRYPPMLGHFYHSLQNQPDFGWLHFRTSPVVEVILQVPIANAKLQLLQKFTVLHEIEGIEDIKVLFLGKHQSVSHEVDPWSSSGYVVE